MSSQRCLGDAGHTTRHRGAIKGSSGSLSRFRVERTVGQSPPVLLSGVASNASAVEGSLAAKFHDQGGRRAVEAGLVPSRSFERLRVHSIGLPQVLFQSITHMAPAAAVAYSIYISVPFSRQALALSVLLALIACLCASVAIGQLAKLEPSAGPPYPSAPPSPRPLSPLPRP